MGKKRRKRAEYPDSKYAKNFRLLLDRYRHPDGERWMGTQIAAATGKGSPGTTYISGVLTGAIQNPGGEPLRKIARAMGFPNDYWYMEPEDLRHELFGWEGSGAHARPLRAAPEEIAGDDAASGRPIRAGGPGLAALIDNEIAWAMLKSQGEYTEKDVARASGWRLTENDVKEMRRGAWDRLKEPEELALSDAFGVEPEHWHERKEKRALLTPKTVSSILTDDRFVVAYKPDGWSEDARSIVRILSGEQRQGSKGPLDERHAADASSCG